MSLRRAKLRADYPLGVSGLWRSVLHQTDWLSAFDIAPVSGEKDYPGDEDAFGDDATTRGVRRAIGRERRPVLTLEHLHWPPDLFPTRCCVLLRVQACSTPTLIPRIGIRVILRYPYWVNEPRY